MSKMEAGLAKRFEAGRTSAEKQHVCPVSGEMLGTLSKPTKMTVKEKDVWICCDGCRNTSKKEPEKFLTKVSR